MKIFKISVYELAKFLLTNHKLYNTIMEDLKYIRSYYVTACPSENQPIVHTSNFDTSEVHNFP